MAVEMMEPDSGEVVLQDLPASHVDRILSRRRSEVSCTKAASVSLQCMLLDDCLQCARAKDENLLLRGLVRNMQHRIDALQGVLKEKEAEAETRRFAQLLEDCYITEFVEHSVPPPQEPEVALEEVGREDTPCSTCGMLQDKLRELEADLAEWGEREEEFKKKTDECQRLRTILRFSQLKKDSDRLRDTQARMIQLHMELDQQHIASKIVEQQGVELERLREVEREYRVVRRQLWETMEQESGGKQHSGEGGEAGPLRTLPEAERGNPFATPNFGLDDAEVSFSTICDRMKQWLHRHNTCPAKPSPVKEAPKSKADTAGKPGDEATLPLQRPLRRARVGSAPPGGRRKTSIAVTDSITGTSCPRSKYSPAPPAAVEPVFKGRVSEAMAAFREDILFRWPNQSLRKPKGGT